MKSEVPVPESHARGMLGKQCWIRSLGFGVGRPIRLVGNAQAWLVELSHIEEIPYSKVFIRRQELELTLAQWRPGYIQKGC